IIHGYSSGTLSFQVIYSPNCKFSVADFFSALNIFFPGTQTTIQSTSNLELDIISLLLSTES
ncbi:hypothetical protein ACQP3L_37490, partial [Escherichia coli]